MSKDIFVLGAAVIALALFWKPISNMLNGIIGGASPEEQYFKPRDTSTSQGPAYDPPNPDAPPGSGNALQPGNTLPGDALQPGNKPPTAPAEPQISDKILDAIYQAGRKDQAQQDQQGSSGQGSSGSPTDHTGADTANIGNQANDIGKGSDILSYLKTPDGMVNAAIVTSIAAPAIYKYGKPATTKAYQVLKEQAPKLKNIAKRAGTIGVLAGAVTLAASDKGAFGIGDALTKYVTNPIINFGDTVLGLKPVNAITSAQAAPTPAVKPPAAPTPAVKPPAAPTQSSGITVSNKPISSGGVSSSNKPPAAPSSSITVTNQPKPSGGFGAVNSTPRTTTHTDSYGNRW